MIETIALLTNSETCKLIGSLGACEIFISWNSSGADNLCSVRTPCAEEGYNFLRASFVCRRAEVRNLSSSFPAFDGLIRNLRGLNPELSAVRRSRLCPCFCRVAARKRKSWLSSCLSKYRAEGRGYVPWDSARRSRCRAGGISDAKSRKAMQ